MLAGPGRGKAGPLVHGPFHSLIILCQNHMEIGGKILQGVPFLMELKVGQILGARERWIDDPHPRLLLGAVNDELAAEHGDIGVDLIRLLVDRPSTWAMKRIAGTVAADEPLAARDGL